MNAEVLQLRKQQGELWMLQDGSGFTLATNDRDTLYKWAVDNGYRVRIA